MNIFKKIYCRTYQFVLKAMMPLLPYREPIIFQRYEDVLRVLSRRKISSVLLVTDSGIRSLGLTKTLEEEIVKAGIKLSVYDKTVANPTTDNVEEALALYKENACEAIIAFGGGSAMDCAKATGARVTNPKKTLAQMKGILKVRKKLPLLIAFPTTAGTGSETTIAAVITDSKTRHKYAINDFPLIPQYAALMPELTLGLPKHITSTTGMDALTHAIEAFIGRSTTKKTRECSIVATKTIFKILEEVYDNGKNLEMRDAMLYASFKAGVAFTRSYVGYVHAMAHALGGKYNIPHGLANAIILPHVLKKFGRKIYKKLWKIGVGSGLFDENTSKEVGAKIVIEKIESMNAHMNIGTSIPEIKEEDIPELAKTAEKEGNPLYPVPVLWTVKDFEDMFREVKNG